MPIRDIFVTILVFGSLPSCFMRPWIGVLVWAWLGYMNPHRLGWGFAYDMPFAQLVAVVMLAGLLVTKERSPLPNVRETGLLIALWIVFFFSTLLAVYPAEAWTMLNKVSKILFMTFVTIILFQDRMKLQALVWVMTLSLGFFGLKGGVWGVLTGGGGHVLGPPGSFIAGNTEIGLALNMILPMIIFLRRDVTQTWLRHFLLAMFGFTVISILLTHSRGALLGLLAVLACLFLKSRAKFIFTLIVCVSIPVALATLPDNWFGKMETISTYEEDTSAMGRIEAWQMASQLAVDRPLFGAGFRCFTPEMYEYYFPGAFRKGVDAHSIFFQVLAEHGFGGITIYIGLILSSLLSLRQMAKKSKDDPDLSWIYNYSQMLEVSLVGYIVCGAFLSRSYFDLFYHIIAIVICMKMIFLTHTQKIARAAEIRTVRPPWALQMSRRSEGLA